MAKKSTSKKAPQRAPKPGKQRYRRTDEELIEDLKRKIDEVKSRAAAKELKQQSEAVKESIKCARSLARTIELAQAEGNSALHHALADAHHALGDYFASEGFQMPRARRPRGRRPKLAGQRAEAYGD